MSPLPAVLLRTQPDERLVQLCRLGHASAFDAVVKRYRAELTRSCARTVGDARAGDAVQQALLAAWTALQRGAEVRELRAWLHVAAHRSALRVLAERDRCDELPDELVAPASTESEAETRAEARRVLALVAALPGHQREALVLTELHGFSRSQVAAELGVSDGAVRALVHRARSSLRAVAGVATPPGLIEQLAGTGGTGGALAAVGATLVGKGAAAIAVAAALAGASAVAPSALPRAGSASGAVKAGAVVRARPPLVAPGVSVALVRPGSPAGRAAARPAPSSGARALQRPRRRVHPAAGAAKTHQSALASPEEDPDEDPAAADDPGADDDQDGEFSDAPPADDGGNDDAPAVVEPADDPGADAEAAALDEPDPPADAGSPTGDQTPTP